jgi:hypothetical protein
MKESWKKDFVNYFWKNISDLSSILIINNEGVILEEKSSDDFTKQYDKTWLKNIAKKISVRFTTLDFHKEMGGLQLTVNVFNEHAIVVRSLKPDLIMIMIVSSKDNSLPNWIKKNSQWWADELIFEPDFLNQIEQI